MIYIYIHRECRSVLVKLHPMTVCFLGMRGSWVECHWFSLVLPIVSCSMIIRLILGSLWPLVFVLNSILILGILRPAISHLPRCFCPWTFFQNIGFNMVPSEPFYATSRKSTRKFFRVVSGFATDCPCGVWCRGLSVLVHDGTFIYIVLGCRTATIYSVIYTKRDSYIYIYVYICMHYSLPSISITHTHVSQRNNCIYTIIALTDMCMSYGYRRKWIMHAYIYIYIYMNLVSYVIVQRVLTSPSYKMISWIYGYTIHQR